MKIQFFKALYQALQLEADRLGCSVPSLVQSICADHLNIKRGS